jgi:hypothetical protein
MGRASCPRLLPFYTTYYLTGTEGQPEEEKSYSHLSMLIFRLEKTKAVDSQNQRLKSLPKIVIASWAFWSIARGILSPLFTETGIHV